jgi:predicted ATPase
LGFCEQTAVRPETQEESLNIERLVENGYRSLGFQIVRIPAVSIEERANMILSHVSICSRV